MKMFLHIVRVVAAVLLLQQASAASIWNAYSLPWAISV
jgi:hypothetical protein